MGITYLELKVANPAKPNNAQTVQFLVDSGAVYSVVSTKHLKKLGIKPHSKKTFTLADGTAISRDVGDALFEFEDHRGASPVIFGKIDDSNLLGMVTLEALGLILDPLRRELRPLPMILAGFEKYR